MAPHDKDEDISDDEQLPTCEPYAVLGIEKTATADEIKSAYRKAALKHHPGMTLFSIPFLFQIHPQLQTSGFAAQVSNSIPLSSLQECLSIQLTPRPHR